MCSLIKSSWVTRLVHVQVSVCSAQSRDFCAFRVRSHWCIGAPIQLWASGETTDRSTAIGSRLGLQGMSAGTFLLPRIRVSPKVVVVVLECLGAKFFLRYVDFLELQSVTRSSARVVGYEVLVGPRTVQPLGEALGRG